MATKPRPTDPRRGPARGNRPAARTLAFAPPQFMLVLVAVLLVGVLVGWLAHGLSTATAPGAAGGPAASEMAQRIPVIQDHITEAEIQLASSPANVDLHIHLGNLYYDLSEARDETGDGVGAQSARLSSIEHYEAARGAPSATADVLTDLGTMYFRAGRPQDAIASFEAAIAREPEHQKAWMNMGVVRRQALKDTAGAVAAWKRSLEIDPNGDDAAQIRTWLSQVGGVP